MTHHMSSSNSCNCLGAHESDVANSNSRLVDNHVVRQRIHARDANVDRVMWSKDTGCNMWATSLDW